MELKKFIKTHTLPASCGLGVVILLSLVFSVSAVNLSFSDGTTVGVHDLLIMNSTGDLIAQGNSTQTFDIGTEATVLVLFKPETMDVIESPNTLLDELARQIRGNLVSIAVGLIVVLLVFRYGRR